MIMSFYQIVEQYKDFNFQAFFYGVTHEKIDRVLQSAGQGKSLSPADFLILLSPQAGGVHLEKMAEIARQQTIQYFGRTIQLFAPIYISNYCTNHCAYCGFHQGNGIERRKLSFAEIEVEAKNIAATGIQHILLLTGEAKKRTPMEYLLGAVAVLRKYFASVSIEIFPMETEQYQEMFAAGVDGLTLFQETYDEVIYKEVHLGGKKRDYHYRLNAPERGATAGFHSVNIGALLGLGEIRREFFFTGMHAYYLDKKYLDTETAISIPRFNPAECGDFTPRYSVDDRTFVQFMLAFRLFMPRSGITVSTRENAFMRDNLMKIGATKFSAGVSTKVGGYSDRKDEKGEAGTPQFEISDERSVSQMVAAIEKQGYQPVYKDWDQGI